jgi:glycogen debranching enzyme
MSGPLTPNIWGDGKLFAFSGIDGPTSWACDLMGSASNDPFGIILRVYPDIALTFGGRVIEQGGHLVLGDACDVTVETSEGSGRLRMAYADCFRMVGEVSGSLGVALDGDLSVTDRHVALATEESGGVTRWCVGLSPDGMAEATARAESGLREDLDALIEARSAFVRGLDASGLAEGADERVYRKCAEILKLNTRGPEGLLGRRWTTPDVWPHRHMWLWDSAFHAVGWAELDGEMAQDAILAVIDQQASDGMIRLCEAPEPQNQPFTQPPVLAWAVWRVFEKTGDEAFLAACYEPLGRFMDWLFRERDANGNGLLEWDKRFETEICRCGESGWDNSPRFDRPIIDDHVDINSMVVREMQMLARMAEALGEEAQGWTERAHALAALVNERLWHEEAGLYLDRGPGEDPDEWMTMKSAVCFLPLIARIPSPDRADRLVAALTDEATFWTPTPLPTVALDESQYSDDMWRGPSWMNINFFIYEGLRDHGYREIAAQLRRRCMGAIEKWYYEAGGVFEFYDPMNETHPFWLHRKGLVGGRGDAGVGVIRDYNFTAAMYIAWAKAR